MDDYLKQAKELRLKAEAGQEPLPEFSVDGKPVAQQRQVDADTLNLGGEAFRLKGFNAPEIAKNRAGVYTPSDVSNDPTEQNMRKVARLGGYTNLARDGKDAYGRTVADLGGLGDTMTSLGLTDINSFSNPEAIQQGMNYSNASSLFPEEAKKDPLLALSMQNKIDSPTVLVPKVTVLNKSQYAETNRMAGVAAASEAAKEVDRLTKILNTEQLRPELREKLTKQLGMAQQQVFLAASTPAIAGNVLINDQDRYLDNQAKSQFSTSLHNAGLEMLRQLGGIGEISGDQLKWDWLADKGKSYAQTIKAEQNDLPDTLSSFKDIKTTDTWSTVKDTTTYLGNLMAGTLPFVGMMTASTLATGGMNLPGLAAMGVASIPSALMYTGGFYNDQPEGKKNAPLALSMGVASGVLDTFGLGEMAFKHELFSIAGKKELAQAIIKSGKAGSLEEAEKLIEDATKKQLVDLSTIGSAFARYQYQSKEAALRGLGSLAKSTATEGTTEALQQTAEMVAKGGEWNMDAQYERDFYQQLLDAAVGGGAMGGAFHSVGAVKDAASWHALANAGEAFQGTMTEAQRFQADNREKLLDKYEGVADPEQFGGYTDVKQMAGQVSSMPTNSLEHDIHKIPVADGAWNSFKAIVTDPAKLLRQLVDTAIPTITNEDGTFKTNLAYIKAIMGGSGILPGDSAAGYKQRLMGRWDSSTAEELATSLRTSVARANAMVREAWQTTWSKNEKLDPTSPLQQWKDRMDSTLADMYNVASEAGVDTSEVASPHAMFESSAVHPETIIANKEKIINELVNTGVANRAIAKGALDNLLSGDRTKAANARAFLAEHGMFTNPKLNKYLESNLFTSMENLKDRLSSAAMHSTYLGQDGSNLVKLLDRALANGELTEEEYKLTAKEVKDWYDITTGQYHPLDKTPRLKKVLGWATTLTMLASLGKAALSSQVELAMSTLGTPGDLVNKQIKSYTSNFAREIRSDMNKFGSWSTASLHLSALNSLEIPRNIPSEDLKMKIEKYENELAASPDEKRLGEISNELESLYNKYAGHNLFDRLGYNDTGYNTQTKFEYEDSNMKTAMHLFSTVILLRAQTDSTRLAVLSVAGDTVMGKLQSLMMVPKDKWEGMFQRGEHITNEQAQSLRELEMYGMDVPMMMAAMSKADGVNLFNKDGSIADAYKPMSENLYTTLGNLVDSRVVNPQAHNLPKYFNDPRLRVITAMGRFMATAHAVVLPRLYRQYLLDGNVGMRYQAFSVIAGALLLGAVANMLKDQLSYGEDSPYINGKRKNIQRTINSSGIIGQYERIVDNVFPIYPQTGAKFSNNPALWLGSQVTQASPVLSWATKPVAGAIAIGEGNTPKGIKSLVRASPLVGSFPQAASYISSLFKKEN